ncbi:MAG: hypothetical protein H6Q76_2485 [Firmicutes bacterium]|nr:hypothetical protein [Bacillota bacterium]
MKLPEVKEIAREKGIRLGKMNKTELIHAIQVQENNTPCYGKNGVYCDQGKCRWREDCVLG